MSAPDRIRGGIVGAGRSRNGLGPFLAAHFEDAGGEVVAVAGRDAARAAAAAAQLEARFGHPVRAHGSLADLLREPLEALIIAAPVAAHLPALRAAVAAGVPVLCEKPLVDRHEGAAVDGVLDGFAARGLLLMENCQWPLVLDAWRQLFPQGAGPVGEVAMGLSPAASGPGMLADALSHLLSVVQEVAAVDADTGLRDLAFAGTAGVEDGLDCSFALDGPATVRCRLELRACPEQPRPAWLALDGARMDREIDLSDYSISFRAGARSVRAGDPTAALVYRFAAAIREASDHERIRTESDRIRHRARIYHAVLDGFDRHCGGRDAR